MFGQIPNTGTSSLPTSAEGPEQLRRSLSLVPAARGLSPWRPRALAVATKNSRAVGT